MRLIGVVVNDARPEAAALADSLAAWAEERGAEVRLAPPDTPDGRGGEEGAFAAGLDLVVSLGGDGTMLRAVALVGAAEVPVLGVNLGQMGYLTVVEPDSALAALDRFAAGTYTLEDRMVLDVKLVRADGRPPTTTLALNEAVLEKTHSGHTVRIEARLDGELFTPYEADALIVATPTGSTAYAFSARGPIIAPAHRALLLTPVSAHMLFDRSLVLGPDTVIDLTVARSRPATLTVDGREIAELGAGDRVRCRASATRARLVTFGTSDFHAILKAKFGLSDR